MHSRCSPRPHALRYCLVKMNAASFLPSTPNKFTLISVSSSSTSHLRKCPTSFRQISATASGSYSASPFSLEAEIAQAVREGRRYNIDKSKLTPKQLQELRLRSKAIPMVADNDPLDVIFEDDHFLVVNKPAYLKMHPCHRFEGGSLLNRAIGYCGFMPYILHRLDMHTTGVVVIAKKKALCNPIMKQFMGGHVRKEYLCVVDGLSDDPIGSSFVVDAPVQRHRVKFVREIGTTGVDSKPAQTKFSVIGKSVSRRMMLLSAAPLTGRTHQIRLHAKETSLPIVGDALYNHRENNLYSSYDEITAAAQDQSLTRYADNNPLRKGLKLHAWKISLTNPLTSEPLHFCASPPSDMVALMNWAGMEVPACSALPGDSARSTNCLI